MFWVVDSQNQRAVLREKLRSSQIVISLHSLPKTQDYCDSLENECQFSDHVNGPSLGIHML